MRWLSGLFGRVNPTISADGALFEAAPDSRELVIVFSSRNRTNFEMQRALEGLNANKLHVKDRTGQSWFHDGVEGLSCDIRSTAEALSTFIKAGRFKRVTCIGASMGGYAAILFGALLKINRVVAFSPQTAFHPGWPYIPATDAHIQEIDLSKAVGGASKTRFHIISSSELHDVYQASLIAKHKNVCLDVIEWDHNTLAKVKMATNVSKFIVGLLIGERHVALTFKANHVMRNMPASDVFQMLDRYYRGKHKKCIEMCRYLLLRNDRSFEVNLILGQCLFFRHEYEQALQYLKRAYQIDNSCLRTHPALICSFAALGLDERAREGFYEYRGAIKSRKNNPAAPLARLANMADKIGAIEFAAFIRSEIAYLGDNVFADATPDTGTTDIPVDEFKVIAGVRN